MNVSSELPTADLADLLADEPVIRVSAAVPPTAVRPTASRPTAILPAAIPLAEIGISAIVLDSRRAVPGALWVALPGTRTHGAHHAADPLAAPVAAVLTDPAGEAILDAEFGSVDRPPVVVVDDPRAVMARMAARLHHHPARRLTTYGVTGTNGKTTTCFLLQSALRAVGHHCGLIGTVGFRLDDAPIPGAVTTTVTTPESVDLQGILAELVNAGADTLTMEVSSHALALQRVDGIVFDVAGFANLGVDHLDFHRDLEDYFAAKARLFTPERCRRAVINIDDPYGRRLADSLEVPLTTVSVDDPDRADVGVRRWAASTTGTRVTFVVSGQELTVDLALPGEHNVRNALLALGMIVAAGADDPAIAVTGFARARVPGRMEPVELRAVGTPPGEGAQWVRPGVFVDFAHTPQAVEAAGHAFPARDGDGPVVVVVGSGGDRDPGKRAPIGAAAASAADIVVVTDDNPRTEDPQRIRDQIRQGAEEAVAAGARASEVIDGGERRSAIALALTRAAVAPGGTVLVLGRGHETHQLTADGPVEFHDATVIAEVWDALLDREA